ncbi:MAG: FUSC family protein, partial [Solirubrobacteraceae bacterium]
MLQSPAGRHALRLAVVVLVTEVIAQHIPLQRSYWMVVAAAAALRPEFAATFTRGAERIIGTCLGVALAGLIVAGLHPSLGAVVAIIGALGWLAYSVFPASFAVGFAFLTALVVFLLDAVSTDTLTIAGDRLIDALIGGAIGLLAYLVWPTWSDKPARQALADVVAAQRAY